VVVVVVVVSNNFVGIRVGVGMLSLMTKGMLMC